MWLHREAFARLLIDALMYRDRSDARLRAEGLALRYHLRVLERRTNRPRWQPTDRLLLPRSAASCPGHRGDHCCPARKRCSAGIGSWSGEQWAVYRRRTCRRRPAPRCELHELIVRKPMPRAPGPEKWRRWLNGRALTPGAR